MNAPASPPLVRYWHLWTDTDGVSHQKECALTEFVLKSMQPPADPQWQGRRSSGAMTTLVTVQPVGWVGNWHENPKPQWIVPLSGRWFVESMDGTRIEMGPGEISFGGDQHCREKNGRLGHRSGTVGEEPVVLLVIQLDDLAAPWAPCAFR
jgi:hypothetical protein